MKADKEEYEGLYEEAGIPIYVRWISSLQTERWMDEGYYKGRAAIYTDILEKITLSGAKFEDAMSAMKALEGSVLEKLNDTNERDIVVDLLGKKRDEFSMKLRESQEKYQETQGKLNELVMFLKKDPSESNLKEEMHDIG